MENKEKREMPAEGDAGGKRRVYEAPGLLDFTLRLRAGAAWTVVEFTGGRSSGYGNHWAWFATEDPVLAYLIEKSPEYGSGRIIRGRDEG